MNEKKALGNGTTHVILGVDLHMNSMAETLENAGIEKFIVVDYEAEVDVMELADVHFYSPRAAKRKFEKERKIVFHKLLCRGMHN